MLRKPNFRFIQQKDLGPSAPPWIEVLLSPFNDIIQFLIDAFKGNISISNLNIQKIDYEFTAPFVATTFAKTKNEPVQGVQMVQLCKPNLQPHGGNQGFDWAEQGNNVIIQGIYGLNPGDKFKVRFFVNY